VKDLTDDDGCFFVEVCIAFSQMLFSSGCPSFLLIVLFFILQFDFNTFSDSFSVC